MPDEPPRLLAARSPGDNMEAGIPGFEKNLRQRRPPGGSIAKFDRERRRRKTRAGRGRSRPHLSGSRGESFFSESGSACRVNGHAEIKEVDILRRTFPLVLVSLLLFSLPFSASVAFCGNRAVQWLSAGNLQAPFCYRPGSVSEWPIFEKTPPESASIQLSIDLPHETLADGETLLCETLKMFVSPENKLKIESPDPEETVSFKLRVSLWFGGRKKEEQTLTVRPAPPDRPITYLADFGDDIIRIFPDPPTGRFQPIVKSGFDPYFRRLQAHGVTRLIVWLGPHPYITDPSAYSEEDWNLFEKQARAIVESEALDNAFEEYRRQTPSSQKGGYTPYGWIRRLLALRLMPDFGEMLSQSAQEHGIRLTLSFRPFEGALTKYYEIPTFDEEGQYLWGFLPMGSPTLNFHPDRLGFAHYRTLLIKSGRSDEGTLDTIEFPAAANVLPFLKRFQSSRDNLQILASPYPPIREDSFVLQRTADGDFTLRRFQEIRPQADRHRCVLQGFDIEQEEDDTLRISRLNVPDDSRFLLLWNPSGSDATLNVSVKHPITLRSRAGNRLGRENVYWVLDESEEERHSTRIAGIPPSGVQHTEFNATETSWKHVFEHGLFQKIQNATLVIDLGSPWSVEMMDLNREATRKNVLAEIRTILKDPVFDEIFINTRSHTQLPGYRADGELGPALIQEYRRLGKPYSHLGIDLAYAPIGLAGDSTLTESPGSAKSVERITCWQPGEWRNDCLSPNTPYAWRFARNRAIARGIRKLLIDLEQEFPGVRIRMVIPPGETALDKVKKGLAELKRPDGTFYGVSYYRRLASTINYIRSIGEGMTWVDLSGLRVEPVLFGIRGLIDPAPLELYLEACLEDLEGNRGSSYQGNYSIFYEAQETLRAPASAGATEKRRRILCTFLSLDLIDEVILYEAADWLYFLSLSDPDSSGYGFLDHCLPKDSAFHQEPPSPR